MATEKLSPGALRTKAKPKRAAIYARVSNERTRHERTEVCRFRSRDNRH